MNRGNVLSSQRLTMNSKIPSASYEKMLQDHSGLISLYTQRAYRLRKVLHEYVTRDECRHYTEIAAWLAWKKQTEQVDPTTGESPHAFGTYLNTFILYTLKSMCRGRRGGGTSISDVGSGETVIEDKDIIDVEESDQLKHSLAILSDQERQVIKCRYLDGLTLKQTSEALNIDAYRIRQIQQASLNKMKRAILRSQHEANGNSSRRRTTVRTNS